MYLTFINVLVQPLKDPSGDPTRGWEVHGQDDLKGQ